ncbi:MAG: polymer-forming cytoskeletal protein [Pseudomonadota bacterium]
MKRKDHSIRLSENVSAIIQEGCEFKGKLSFEGLIRLGGKFEGEIFTNDILIIENSAFVRGDIQADVVIISGKVVGDIEAKNRIEIFKPAMIKGNLSAPVISMEQGVVFEGSTKMG